MGSLVLMSSQRVESGRYADVGADETARAATARSPVADLWYLREAGGLSALAPVPQWGQFMAKIGTRLATCDRPAVTVGLTVPTRGFAAVIAAASAVTEYDSLNPMAPDDLDKHIQLLRETPEGTPIQVQLKDRISDGRWLGIKYRDGDEKLSFETRKMVRGFPLSWALKIRLTGEAAVDGQLMTRRAVASPLAKRLLGESAAVTFMTGTRLDCVVVGTQAVLKAELTEQEFYAGTRRAAQANEGRLQDLVRARDLLGARRYYRSMIVPSVAETSEELASEEPKLVILDGGRAYQRWRHTWPGAHHLVILDRALGSTEESAAHLSLAYAQRSADSDLLSCLRIPTTMEAIAFERRL